MLEIIMYVNQVNPACTISDAQLQAVHRKLASLTGTLRKPSAPSYGYRGVKLRQGEEIVSAFKELVVVEIGATTRRFHDHCRELEKFLLDIISPQLPNDKYELLIKPSFGDTDYSESYY